MARSILIQVSGIDGSGKTTIARTLYRLLELERLPVVLMWFRFPYFLSLPLLLLMRIIGLTKVYVVNGKGVTIHFFAPIRKVFTILYVLDFTIHYILRYKLRTILPIVLISDRGPLDSLVDLLVDIETLRVSPLLIKYFVHLQIKGITIMPMCNYDTLIKRRPDASVDPKFKIRLKMYEVLLLRYQDLLRPIFINTEKEVKENERLLYTISRVVRLNYGHLGLSKRVENKLLKAILASKASIVINWFFQGVKIADIVENAFRLLLDSVFFIVVYILSNNILLSLLALMVAHTINYFLNSNGPRIRAILAKRTDIQGSLQLIENYVKNNPPGRSIEAIVIFGSITRKSASKYSDIDMRVVRRYGIKNALLSFMWAVKFRLYLWRQGIPGDIFIATRERLAKTIRSDELENLIYIWRCE